MVGNVLGFFELGAIILAWTIVWNFLIKGITARYADQPWAQGLAANYHA
jgi:hypothetical protein